MSAIDPENCAPEGEPSPEPGEARRLLARTLALLWIFPSLGACAILWLRPAAGGGREPGWAGALRAVSFEKWVAAGLLLVHLGLILRVWSDRSARRKQGP